jgi:hypothetical protein
MRDRGRRNPQVVIVEIQSLTLQRCLEMAIGIGDLLGDGFDAQGRQNTLSAGFQVRPLLAGR